MKLTVWELQPGDECYIEDNLGNLFLAKVRQVGRYKVYVGRQRFYKKSGWEVMYKNNDLSRGHQPTRDRIHSGDGILFTHEDADRRTLRQRERAYREELIYTITHLKAQELRKLPTEQLAQCVHLLTTEVTTNEHAESVGNAQQKYLFGQTNR